MSDRVTCPNCKGQTAGVSLVKLADREDCVEREWTCGLCRGEGLVSADLAAAVAVRDAARHARIDRRESLREAAARRGVTVAQYSAWERGKDL